MLHSDLALRGWDNRHVRRRPAPAAQPNRLHPILAEVEWPTIFFFIGLFILVGGIKQVGLLDRIARRTVSLTGGNVILTALDAALVCRDRIRPDRQYPGRGHVDSADVLGHAVAVSRARAPQRRRFRDCISQVTPFWWSLALGACLGGNGTLVGASANVVAVGIAERRDEPIGFWGFTRVGAPFALISLIVSSVYVWLRYFAF